MCPQLGQVVGVDSRGRSQQKTASAIPSRPYGALLCRIVFFISDLGAKNDPPAPNM